jgi:hypothetical protein
MKPRLDDTHVYSPRMNEARAKSTGTLRQALTKSLQRAIEAGDTETEVWLSDLLLQTAPHECEHERAVEEVQLWMRG